MSQSFIKKPDNGPHSALGGLGVLRAERPATAEEAQHAAQIGACLPNGVMFDAFGNQRTRYVRITVDGMHLICEPCEVETNLEGLENYTLTDVYLSEQEHEALPEFEGW